MRSRVQVSPRPQKRDLKGSRFRVILMSPKGDGKVGGSSPSAPTEGEAIQASFSRHIEVPERGW